jgi:hypothetical protein
MDGQYSSASFLDGDRLDGDGENHVPEQVE